MKKDRTRNHQHPDSSDAVELRRSNIQQNWFLQNIYNEWHAKLVAKIPTGSQPVLEIGANGPQYKDTLTGLITSDIVYAPSLDIVLDGQCLPFSSESLRGIVMTDVLHHLPSVRHFFSEAERCLIPEGKIVMVEPWLTPWSRLIYGLLHHEPCEPARRDWEFESNGPMSGANIALPWIAFKRDRLLFEKEFPKLRIVGLELDMPFIYLLSGGVSRKSLFPFKNYGFWRGFELRLRRWINCCAMFAQITIIKRCE